MFYTALRDWYIVVASIRCRLYASRRSVATVAQLHETFSSDRCYWQLILPYYGCCTWLNT